MNLSLSRLWRALLGTRADALPSDPPTPADAAASIPRAAAASDLLTMARALAREGRPAEASKAYWSIKRAHQTVEGLLEHAELLLEAGDHFGAASRAYRVLELDPENARAVAVQREIVRREAKDERRSARE